MPETENRKEEGQEKDHVERCGRAPCPASLGLTRTIVLSAVAWALFGLLLLVTPLHGPTPLDLAVSLAIQSINFPGFFGAMWDISLAGTTPWVAGTITLAVIIALVFRRWVIALFIAVSPLAEGVDALIKAAIGRQRPSPSLVHVQTATQLPSFPSGHVFYFAFFYGLLCYMILPNLSRPWLRWLAIAFTATLSVVIGISRIYLGAHWFSDVIGGYLLGATLLIPYTQIYAYAERRINARKT